MRRQRWMFARWVASATVRRLPWRLKASVGSTTTRTGWLAASRTLTPGTTWPGTIFGTKLVAVAVIAGQ